MKNLDFIEFSVFQKIFTFVGFEIVMRRKMQNLKTLAEFYFKNQSVPECCTPIDRSTATGTDVPLDGQQRSITQIRLVAIP